MQMLLAGPGVLGAHRGGQGFQYRGIDGGTLGGEVPSQDACPGERGLHPDLAVLERRLGLSSSSGRERA
jgi:hypothetical protein